MNAFWSKLRVAALFTAIFVAASPAVHAASDDEDDPFYEGFFATQILSLSQSNLTVGVLGDSIAKGVYEGEQAVSVAEAYSQLIAASNKVVAEVAAAEETDKEDAELLKKVVAVGELIKQQADAVVGIARGQDGAGAAFSKAREATQKDLPAVIKEVTDYFKP